MDCTKFWTNFSPNFEIGIFLFSEKCMENIVFRRFHIEKRGKFSNKYRIFEKKF